MGLQSVVCRRVCHAAEGVVCFFRWGLHDGLEALDFIDFVVRVRGLLLLLLLLLPLLIAGFFGRGPAGGTLLEEHHLLPGLVFGVGHGVDGFPVRFVSLRHRGQIGARGPRAVEACLLLLGGGVCVLRGPCFGCFGVVGRDGGSVLGGEGGELAFRGVDVDTLEEVERRDLHVFEVVVVGEQGFEIRFLAVEGRGDAPADVDFAFDLQVFKGLLPEPLFPEGAGAAGDGTGGGALGEDAVHARFAHFVIALRVHEESHFGVEVAGGFADGADVCSFGLTGNPRV